MPTTVFRVASVGQERRHNRHTREWFKVWTIERIPEDGVSAQESYSTYETCNPWIASICEAALRHGKPVEVIWKDSPWLRVITQVREVEQESAA